MNFPIESATILPGEWFSGRCLAPLSRIDSSPEQEIADANVICDQAKALVGDRLGQNPADFAEWRAHVFARCTILAAGRAAELLVFTDIDPLSNSLDQALSRIFAASVCAVNAIVPFLCYCEAEATALLMEQRHVLDALAAALQAAGSIDATKIDEVICEAVSARALEAEKARRKTWAEKIANAARFEKDVHAALA
ncbi:MAG: hypothetical protein ACLP4V_25490 [Methylocella sp.]